MSFSLGSDKTLQCFPPGKHLPLSVNDVRQEGLHDTAEIEMDARAG